MKTGTIAAIAAAFGLANGCLLEREIHAEREFARTGKRATVHHGPVARQASSTLPIGEGDRFDRGCKVPKGLGVKERDLKSVLNVGEVESALKGLKKGFPNEVELFEPPFETYEKRHFPGLIIGDNPRVFIMSGIHARERGGPDNVIYFLGDLLAARKAGKGVKYGDKSYTAEEVKTALSAGVVAIPLINPDGVAYDQKTGTCWRKNRNPESSKGAEDGRDVGIDLNRNYDFVWDFEDAFYPGTEPASTDPASEVFYGTAPASEPETQAVVWTLDQYQNLTWFMDLHSYGPSILYAWGDDETQTKMPAENFVNPKYDGKRGLVGEPDPANAEYMEYFLSNDLKIEEDVTTSMRESMIKAGGSAYENYPAVGLYPTSGASNDYAMGRFYGNLTCGASRMFGLTMEFGEESSADPSCPFYPSKDEYHRNVRQVGAGFLEMMLLAAGKAGDPLYAEC